ncbi:MAG: L,D-transpeptidase [Verrucomicrobia bacterium]|nr:L,D-transpeptidase [Verrucomicrobiota bacterium]MBV8378199.1 L,D-transpeptidase [Verrucomicrobiota bacterium]
MKSYYVRALFVITAIGFALLTGCGTLPTALTGKYEVAAYKPRNPSDVRVKVSLQNRMIYVVEGSRPLLVTPTTIGKAGATTPTGLYHVTDKIRKKRSSTYGFWARGNDVRPGTSDHSPGAGYHYVGYPMAYWVEFKPSYGFHQGAVWPIPHSHGCLRLHPNAAPKFFALVHLGTPVYIAQTLPEDQTIGKTAPRPTDYSAPDPPATFMVSDAVFAPPQGPLLLDK